MNRRDFLNRAGSVAGVMTGSMLAATRLMAAAQTFRVGCATTTHLHAKKETASFWWGVEDLSKLGFKGTEADDMIARLSWVYAAKTAEFNARMAKYSMSLPALFHQLPEHFVHQDRKELLTNLMKVGKFMKETGGTRFNLSGPDPVPKGDMHVQIKGICEVSNELGKRLRDELGISLGYHPEMGSVFGGRADIARLMDGTKPEVFNLHPDVGHLTGLGCDPMEVLKAYRQRITHMHAKDFDPKKKKFVRLGEGVVDFPKVVDYLNQTGYKGWFMIELDPPVTTPMEDCKANHAYATGKLKLSLA